MFKFRYHAMSADQQPVSGELESKDVQQAIAELAARGLTVRSIEMETSAEWPHSLDKPWSDARRRAGDTEHEVLRTHLARIRTDGAAIVPALRAYAQQMPWGRRRHELLTLIRVVEHGDLDEAERGFRKLPEYWISLLSAATSSRDPGRVVLGFLEESQQADELRRQRWLALAYPFLVACLAVAVAAVICIFIVPGFREIYDDFDLQLPGLTLLILNISDWIRSPWIVAVGTFLVAIAIFAAYAGRLQPFSILGGLTDRLRLPFNRATSIARFTQFLSDLLDAGLTVPDALRIAGVSSRRQRFRRATGRLADQIESGSDVPVERYERVLTHTVLHALQTEISNKSRIRLLKEISYSYSGRANARLSWTRGALEPIAVVVIGLAVGVVVIALFLPLVKLVEGLSM